MLIADGLKLKTMNWDLKRWESRKLLVTHRMKMRVLSGDVLVEVTNKPPRQLRLKENEYTLLPVGANIVLRAFESSTVDLATSHVLRAKPYQKGQITHGEG
jgi:hypothetical protein